MATIGLPGQPVDVLAGDDVDARSGRLLTVAELQRALTLAVGTRTDGRRPGPAVDGADGPAVTAAPEARKPAACPADPPAELELDPGPDLRWGAAPVPVGPAGDRPVPAGGSRGSRSASCWPCRSGTVTGGPDRCWPRGGPGRGGCWWRRWPAVSGGRRWRRRWPAPPPRPCGRCCWMPPGWRSRRPRSGWGPAA